MPVTYYPAVPGPVTRPVSASSISPGSLAGVHLFPVFGALIGGKLVNLGTDTLMAGLIASGTFTWGPAPQTYEYVSQFLAGDGVNGALTEVSTSGTGYSRLPLTGVTVSTSGAVNTLTCGNIVWPLVTISASYAFFYDASAGSGDTSHPILAYWDFGGPQPVSDNSFTLKPSASGLATWTSS